MGIRKLALTAILSASLSSAPVMAQQAQAAPASTLDRSSAEMSQTSAQAGEFPFLILLLLILLGLGVGVGLSGGKNTPASP
jgi:hypothetical protein